MAGISKVSYVGSAGSVMPQGAGVGDWDFIYSTSLVKDREREVGDRVVLPDGRVYRYGKSTAACWAGRGVRFEHDIAGDGLDWVLAASNQVVGDRQITLTNATLNWAKDALRGGYLLVCHATDDEPQNRMIVGNNAVSAGTNVIVYLDGPLTRLVSSGVTRILATPSPYQALCSFPPAGGAGTEHWTSVAGVPAAYVDVANKYFWMQTWGPCWVAFQGTPGVTQSERQLVWRHDGSACAHDDAIPFAEFQQHAGFIIDAGNGVVVATWINLQINP